MLSMRLSYTTWFQSWVIAVTAHLPCTACSLPICSAAPCRYRAPELCGSFFAKYSPAIDIWGVGCIFAEVGRVQRSASNSECGICWNSTRAEQVAAANVCSTCCGLLQVLLGRPLFPGKNVVNQLELITDLLGTPSPDVVAKVGPFVAASC